MFVRGDISNVNYSMVVLILIYEKLCMNSVRYLSNRNRKRNARGLKTQLGVMNQGPGGINKLFIDRNLDCTFELFRCLKNGTPI